MGHLLKQGIANLPPAYFALVMATGTLSLAANSLGFRLAATVLLYINAAVYLILVFLTAIRLIRYFPNLASDFTSHKKGPGFFTLVAGTCIFGSQLITVNQMNNFAYTLWIAGLLLWIVVMYGFFFSVISREDKPELREGINGAWLIAAVATQSVSILGTSLAEYIITGKIIVLFVSLCMFLLGCMLYLNIIALIFYRLTFLELKSSAVSPPYWINMGAVAIATLAGSSLILNSRYWPMLQEIVPFLKGFTLFFWITGTWWIPILIILTLWRLLYHRIPIRYNAQYWSMVFPLAMYTFSTYKLSQALPLSFLRIIPYIFFYISAAVWLTGIGLLLYHLFLDSNKRHLS